MIFDDEILKSNRYLIIVNVVKKPVSGIAI